MRSNFFIVVCAAALTFLQQPALGQNLNPVNLTNVLPPTPEVASLGKFFSIPVSYSTGLPEISVPFYTVAAGEMSVSVGLNYNASGIRVEEVSTWVGLGWNLNAGGSVSRTVRGLPDEQENGYMNATGNQQVKKILNLSPLDYANTINDAVGPNSLDVEPDIFFFSIFGYSGRFYFDQASHQFIMASYQHITIEYQVSAFQITSWIFTLPNGVKCYFGNSQNGTRPVSEGSGAYLTTNIKDGTLMSAPSSPPTSITSWPIAETRSPSGRSIFFDYVSFSVHDCGRSGETTDYNGLSTCIVGKVKETTSSYYVHAYSKPVLNSISTDLMTMQFIRSTTSRQDVGDDQRALDAIVVSDKNGNVLKRFELTYDYFVSSDAPAFNPTPWSDDVFKKRLYLKKATITDAGRSLNEDYIFSYNTSKILPNRLSNSQDYWGYYNGKNTGAFLTPKVLVSAVYGSGNGYLDGSDRTVDPDYAQACMLTRIQYPTRGTTTYTYESNYGQPTFAANYMSYYQVSGQTQRTIAVGNGIQTPQPVDGGSTFNYVQPFTVTHNIVEQAQLVSSCDGCSDVLSSACPLNGVIKGVTNPSFEFIIKQNLNTYITLPDGDYILQANITPTTALPNPNVSIVLKWSENGDVDNPNDPVSQSNFLIGGLRVRKIITDDGMGGQVSRSYDYGQFGNHKQSSGFFYSFPVNAYKVYCTSTNEQSPSVTRLVSNSTMPVVTLDGQGIRYTNITEYFDSDKSSYKTEYVFSVASSANQITSLSYPFAPSVLSDWEAGRLLEKKDYRLIANTYSIVKDEKHTYVSMAAAQNDSFGIRVVPFIKKPSPSELPPPTLAYGANPYSFFTEWYLPDSIYTAEYGYAPGSATPVIKSVSVKNFYNDHFFIGKTRTRNSKGQTIDSRTWYPFDYNNISGWNFSQLVASNIIESPVKQEVSKDGKITAGQVIQHNPQGKVIQIYAYENAALADTAALDPNTILTPFYQSKTLVTYDIYFNIAQIIQLMGAPTGYLWDYNGFYPIASIKNAVSSSYAYTSFEADGTGNWIFTDPARDITYSFTGSRSYDLKSGGTITASVISGKKYIVSYWSRNGAITVSANGSAVSADPAGSQRMGWTYYQHILPATTNAVSLSSTATVPIDELRLLPADAQMTTFTYDPVVGVTSRCDEANRITYYVYDGLGRLQYLKDQDGNIIKTYEYHYAGLTE